MTTPAAAATPADPGGRGFSGADVAEAAGLRLQPGSPRPVFDRDVWDFSGLADAPAVMGAHRKVLDFTSIANPRWRLVAREYLMARLAPRHPAVATLPHALRTPLNPHSLWAEVSLLAGWFNHLTGAGVASLAEVGQHHCDTYLEAASWSTTDPGRRLSPATVTARVRAAQSLALYTEILSDGYRPGFRPWAHRSADDVAGYVRTNINTVAPVPDTLLRPLLAGVLYLVDTVGPHLAAEAAAARAADQRVAASRRALLVGELDALRAEVERRRTAGIPAPRIAPTPLANRLAGGWDAHDPLLHLAWHPVVVDAAGAMGHRRDLERLRPELERWAGECGIEEPWCRDAAPVPRHDTGEPVPWARPMRRCDLDATVYALTSACFYLTSALSGMRASELAELAAGCRRQEARPGGGHRYRLLTRRVKGEPFGGTEDTWVVIGEAYEAVGLAETLTGAAVGERLFAHESNNSHQRYAALRRWVNGEHGQRLGQAPLPDGPVNPRALRRTLALAIAQRPHGLLAAKVALKHVSVAATEGYVHRPGGHQAAFVADVTAAEQAEHLRLTRTAYDDYTRGVLPAGRGARELITAFEAVDQALAGHDPGPVAVLDDRRVERLLKAKAATLHVGVGNYCWFTDPAKALCLKLAGTPQAREPLLGMCDSARCPQATHHPRHRQVWAGHAEATQAVFLGNPRLSKPERARAQAVADRALRIVADIDAAAGPGGGREACGGG